MPKLALFFTYGVSLKTWDNLGIFNREIKPYVKLSKDIFDEIYLFTYGSKKDQAYQKLLPKNLKIYPKKLKIPTLIYSFFLPLFYFKKLDEVDILKTNQLKGSWVALIAKFLTNKKLIVRCGYEWLKVMEIEKKPWWKLQIAFFLEKLAYKNADKILVTSIGDKKFIEKRFKIASSKIKIIPNYIDIDLFKPLNLKKEKNRICFVGRVSPEKNLSNLIKAISGLNVKLAIFGSGPLKSDLQKFAKKLDSKVDFKGNIPNHKLPEELNKSELFILPSLYEGNPKALLEAMACGLPCIGTNVEGIREIIKHKENGYLCDIDTNSIRNTISELLKNENLRKILGQNARKTILEKFSLKKILEKEIEIYKSL
jgi:glycosyltransferase involved in cell wall biosynthesis